MLIKQNNDNTKSLNSKGSSEQDSRARKIDASTAYETCTEQLSPFGGLLGLIKFLDLIKFEEVFEHLYIKPSQNPDGHLKIPHLWPGQNPSPTKEV